MGPSQCGQEHKPDLKESRGEWLKGKGSTKIHWERRWITVRALCLPPFLLIAALGKRGVKQAGPVTPGK